MWHDETNDSCKNEQGGWDRRRWVASGEGPGAGTSASHPWAPSLKVPPPGCMPGLHSTGAAAGPVGYPCRGPRERPAQ